MGTYSRERRFRAHSSVGQSHRLITGRSLVRGQVGPPTPSFPRRIFRSSRVGGVSTRAEVTVRDVWRALDDHFPFAHRADWDNVGILAGDPAAPVRSVLVALDATKAAVALGARMRIDLLLTHHPLIFPPPEAAAPAALDSRH